jgi:hypothetical protein
MVSPLDHPVDPLEQKAASRIRLSGTRLGPAFRIDNQMELIRDLR